MPNCRALDGQRAESLPEAPPHALQRAADVLAQNAVHKRQQRITALPPLKQPQETPVFGKKRQIHIIFTVKPQQKRQHQHIPQTENMPDGMHRQLRHLLTLLLHHQRLPLLMQIATSGSDIQHVLQFMHVNSLGGDRTCWGI